ncbi:MAG: SAM-dependent chlorinase/fluorinase [Bacteroidota bacterium]
MGCITLLSDFGHQDASVAITKGILMQHVPHAAVVDISHLVEPFHLQQAAYLLLSSYKSFPTGTVHVLLFDVFSEKTPRLLLAEKDGHYFIAPDNGVLSLAFGNTLHSVWNCFELQHPGIFKDWLHQIGIIAAQLQTQTPQQLPYTPFHMKIAPQHWQPKVEGNAIECQVIHIDRYENVVLNISKEQFEEVGNGRPFNIQFMRNEEINTLSTHYYHVREGEKLCRFNATGYLEIAINRGKAASLFGLKLYRDTHLIYSTIKIFFE